jgi:hypothetical protein
MPNQLPEKKKPDTVRETRLESAGEFVVEHSPAPPKGPAEKTIHPRRPLPPVPEKAPKPDDEETPDK